MEKVESRHIEPILAESDAAQDQPGHAAHYDVDFHPSPVSGSHIFTSMEGPSTNASHGTTNTVSAEDRSLVNGEMHNDPLAYPVVRELCKVWFQRYHRWFPILHQSTFMQVLESPQLARVSDHWLVVQAIIASTITHSQLLTSGSMEREQSQSQLVSSVTISCMSTPSVQSVQALLILSVLHYGEGRLLQSWNILAMARRAGAHLGLSNPVGRNARPTASSPPALRRLVDFTNTTVAHEQNVRAYWMSQLLESISTLGASYDLHLSSTPGDPVLPCSDSFWDSPDELPGEHQLRPYHYCSALSLCVILATAELSIVRRFLRQDVTMEIFEERDAWQVEAQRIDERLTAWRDEFVAAVFRLINAEYTNRERPEMDSYVVLTNCVLNTAVITLLQQRATSPQGVYTTVEPWAYANSRCVYACENTAFKVQQMDEDELLVCHPHLIFSIFVAARFYIVHSKALDANVPTNLHRLAFALHTCGKRWPLARSFEKILRIAVGEYRTPVAMSRVPKEFYDLRKTTFGIVDSLLEWVKGPGQSIDPTVETDGGQAESMFMPMSIGAIV